MHVRGGSSWILSSSPRAGGEGCVRTPEFCKLMPFHMFFFIFNCLKQLKARGPSVQRLAGQWVLFKRSSWVCMMKWWLGDQWGQGLHFTRWLHKKVTGNKTKLTTWGYGKEWFDYWLIPRSSGARIISRNSMRIQFRWTSRFLGTNWSWVFN